LLPAQWGPSSNLQNPDAIIFRRTEE
jgi:hypothetical protein